MSSAEPLDYEDDSEEEEWCGPDCPYCNREDWSAVYGEANAYL